MKIRYLLPGAIQASQVADGRLRLSRDANLMLDDELFVISKGFLSDGASFPWLARLLVRWSRVYLAAWVHDAAYQMGAHGKGGGTLSRRQADRLWRDVAMSGEPHANAFQAWVSWAGLRMFGWAAWRRHRRAGR